MTEPAGFREFVAARQSALLRTAWLLTGDWQQAEDLVQTALAKVWPRWERIVAGGEPEAYVRRVLVTSYLTWRRRHWHGERPHADLPDVAAGPDEQAAVEQRDALGRELRRLPAALRTVLILRFYEDLSVDQTAQLLGCSTGTVKSRTSRALERIGRPDPLVPAVRSPAVHSPAVPSRSEEDR